jgi:very-short-patch-repair endonuclease
MAEGNPLLDRRIQEWSQRLIDLTRRNRLLYTRDVKKPTRSVLSVEQPDASSVFNRLVVEEKAWTFWLPPEDDEDADASGGPPSSPSSASELVCSAPTRSELQRTLSSLYRNANTDYRERGIRTLHVICGFLTWHESGASEAIRSPLILCPSVLSRETARDPFALTIADDEDVTLNPALKVKLKRDYNLDLPEPPEDWESTSLSDYLDEVGQYLKPMGWSVENTATLGLFSFHKLAMYQDLTTNATLIKGNSLVRALGGERVDVDTGVNVPDERQLDAVQKPEDTYQILDADSSQQRCIQAALAGRNLVLQGPPGTGKSQTIANIIAEFLARGKTVLFVSEKMAALEVVNERLRGAGLEDFCLELHSHKANKREVITELKRSLDECIKPKQLPAAAEFHKLSELRDHLNRYVAAVHEVREPLGESVRGVLGKLAALDTVPYVPIHPPDPKQLTMTQVQRWEELIRRIEPVWSVAQEGDDFPWRGCRDAEYSLETRTWWVATSTRLTTLLDQLLSAGRELSRALGTTAPDCVGGVESLMALGRHLSASPRPEVSWLLTADLADLAAQAEKYKSVSERYLQIRTDLARRHSDGFFAVPLGTAERLQTLSQRITVLLGLEAVRVNGLVTGRQRLASFARDTEAFSRQSRRDAAALARRLGLTDEGISAERTCELVQLISLCNSGVKPEAAWLDPGRLQAVRRFVGDLQPKCEEYKRKWALLLERYDEHLLDLDIDVLLERFNGFFYRSFLRSLHPGFRRDRRTLLRVTRGASLPASVQDDLCLARDLKRLRQQIDSLREKAHSLLQGYDDGLDTDFGAVGQALECAAEVNRLARSHELPHDLIKLASRGNNVPADILALGKRITESVTQWGRAEEGVVLLVPRAGSSGTGDSLDETPLPQVEWWAHELSGLLAEFCDLVELPLASTSDLNGPDFDTLLADLKRNEEMQSAYAEITAASDRLRQTFGAWYCGAETAWGDLIAALAWASQARDLFGAAPVSPEYARLAERGECPALVDAIQSLHKDAAGLLGAVAERFEPPCPGYEHIALWSIPLDELGTRFAALNERIDDLQTWIDYRDVRQQFADGHLTEFLGLLEVDPPPATLLAPTLRKAVYNAWLEAVTSDDPRLKGFRGRHHDAVVSEFRGLDRRLITLASARVVEQCNARRPQPTAINLHDSELAVLRREAAKKRRHLPVRRLFRQMPNLLHKLKPCILMSPLSVSQFLDPELTQFDLVIFDEASQIYTEDAVGAIYRGRQLIVAGDSKQLPPTDFFKAADQDDESDEGDEPSSADFRSVLEECEATAGMAVQSLRWHYRSRHESLIAFSNHQFYDCRLVTFPAAGLARDGLGVQFVHVPDGVYDRGGKANNPREAEVVADLVFQHFDRYAGKSLGVVAFSQSQMDAIVDEVERRRRLCPEYEAFFKEDRLNGFFVKNLENVQGDERDVMILSVGFGRDALGRFTMNFGPLNKAGGERRLNVIITRAKERVVVVSSVKAGDFDLRGTQASGALNLYHYLDYAERGNHALLITAPSGATETESPLEEDVLGEIRAMGYDATPQVGCGRYRIDIGVTDPALPGRYVLGVECDGASYHSAATARERDRLRQQVLERLGWHIHRIWSPDWVHRRDMEKARLSKAIEDARAGAEHEIDVPTVPASPEQVFTRTVNVPMEPLSADGLMPGTTPYLPCKTLHTPLSGSVFHIWPNRAEHCRLLEQVVREEGPLHIEAAAQRLIAAWGVQRTGSRIMSAVRSAAKSLVQQKLVDQRGDFLWPRGKTDVGVRVPVASDPDTLRPVDQIPPEEMREAMLLIIKQAVGITADALAVETARLFGVGRTSGRIKTQLISELNELVDAGKVVRMGESVSLPTMQGAS